MIERNVMGWRQNLKVVVNKICPALGVSLLYYRQYKRFPRLRNPRLFNEKLQWLKLHVYGKDPVYTVCADKYKVREYLTERGFGDLLIPLIGVYERPEDVDFDALPDRFVLKWNFASGYNIICNDKSKLDVEATVRKLREWGKDENYAWKSYEMQYRDIPRRIVCEENIAPRGKGLVDYKFQCFKGKVLNGTMYTHLSNETREAYSFGRDLKYFAYEVTVEGLIQLSSEPNYFDKSLVLNLMKCAEELASAFHYVRVDLYSIDGRVFFGEFTFTESGGFDRKLHKADVELGAALDLSVYQLGL